MTSTPGGHAQPETVCKICSATVALVGVSVAFPWFRTRRLVMSEDDAAEPPTLATVVEFLRSLFATVPWEAMLPLIRILEDNDTFVLERTGP